MFPSICHKNFSSRTWGDIDHIPLDYWQTTLQHSNTFPPRFLPFHSLLIQCLWRSHYKRGIVLGPTKSETDNTWSLPNIFRNMISLSHQQSYGGRTEGGKTDSILFASIDKELKYIMEDKYAK